MIPVCKCGSRRIELGAEVGACEGTGKLSRPRRAQKKAARGRRSPLRRKAK
jgi:hypothetical protein